MSDPSKDAVQRIVAGVLEGLRPTPLLNEALRAIELDSHNWSPRGCTTCRAITTALGRPFGCDNPEVNRSRRA